MGRSGDGACADGKRESFYPSIGTPCPRDEAREKCGRRLEVHGDDFLTMCVVKLKCSSRHAMRMRFARNRAIAETSNFMRSGKQYDDSPALAVKKE
jgi:hypothetical protein